MSGYHLKDFGGRFLTTGREEADGESYPGISAYLQYFVPENHGSLSATFVHGGGGQGAEFLTTSDGRPGWAHVFLRAGFAVYILDRPGHGRNCWNEVALGASLPPPSYELLYPRFVAPAEQCLWAEASNHTAWPDDPVAGDRFMASQGPMPAKLIQAQRHVEAIGPELFEITGRTVLVSHSAGGPCGWALAAIGGEDAAAVLAIEPLGEPGLEHPLGTFEHGLTAAPVSGRSDPYDRPIAVVTGEATWMRAANASAAAFLVNQNSRTEHICLEKHGIFGNGHMMMSERNSDEIAELLVSWVRKNVTCD